MEDNSTEPWRSPEWLESFYQGFASVNLPLSLAICVFGVAANAANVIVLTRGHMLTATNLLLSGLSAAQLLLCLNFAILQAFLALRSSCSSAAWSMGGASFMKLNVQLNVYFHSVALATTLCLALFRYAAIAKPHTAQYWLRRRTASVWFIGIVFAQAVCGIPVYISTAADEIQAAYVNCSGISAFHDIVWSSDDRVRTASFFVNSVLCNFLPCCLLAGLTLGLVDSLRQQGRRRDELLSSGSSQRQRTASRRSERGRTGMLIVVVSLCLLVELPHGVLKILTAIHGAWFAESYYNSLGDFVDFVTLLYSSINFVVYCAMSREFRRTFLELYCVSTVSKGVTKSVSGTRKTIRRVSRRSPRQKTTAAPDTCTSQLPSSPLATTSLSEPPEE